MAGLRGLDLSTAQLGRSPLIDDVHRRHSWLVELMLSIGSLIVGLVAGFAALIVLGLIAVVIYALAVKGDQDKLQALIGMIQSAEVPKGAVAQLGLVGVLATMNGIAFCLIAVVASVLRRRPVGAIFTSARRFRWRQLFLGMALYGVLHAAFIAFAALTGQLELSWPMLEATSTAVGAATYVLVATLLFIVAAGAEEVLFRGWLLRESAAYTRNVYLLALINGLIFSAIHVNPNTWSIDPTAFLTRTILGMGFVYMALKFGGIEFATGAHAANNILLTLAVEPLSLTEPPPQPFQFTSLIENAVYLAICIGIAEMTFRIPALRRIAGPQDPRPSPTAETFR